MKEYVLNKETFALAFSFQILHEFSIQKNKKIESHKIFSPAKGILPQVQNFREHFFSNYPK